MQIPLQTHGGKSAFNGKLAKWIIGLMPPHSIYVEVFAGGLAVLLHKEIYQDTSEIVNDIHGDLTNFWRVLATTPDRMLRELWGTPFSEVAWNAAEQQLADSDPVRRATAFFIRSRQSRQGLRKGFATLSKERLRGGMNEQANNYWSAIEGLPEIHYRLKRVVVLCQDFEQVIRTNDGYGTFMYLDPPYLHETRDIGSVDCYEYEMTEADHIRLLDLCVNMDGCFALSGYHSKLYDDYAKRHNWCVHEFTLPNNASSKKTKELKTEVLWTNYSK